LTAQHRDADDGTSDRVKEESVSAFWSTFTDQYTALMDKMAALTAAHVDAAAQKPAVSQAHTNAALVSVCGVQIATCICKCLYRLSLQLQCMLKDCALKAFLLRALPTIMQLG
jgi:hypothetical protein